MPPLRTFLLAALLALPSAASHAETATFAVIGDYGQLNPAAARVANLVAGWNPDFVLTTGDNHYGDTALGSPSWDQHVGAYYGQFMLGRADNRYPRQTSPTQRFFPSMGNHDITFAASGAAGPPFFTPGSGQTRDGYLDYFHSGGGSPGRLPAGIHTPGYTFYDFRRGPVHFFALDSEAVAYDALFDDGPSEGATQLQRDWLQAALAGSDAPWKIVYFHHPAYSSGTHGSIEEMQWPFAQWGATAILTGHDHTYERLDRDGALYFVNGLGGAFPYSFLYDEPGSQFRYNEHNGAMRITADETGLRFEFHAAIPNTAGGHNDVLVDSHTIGHLAPEPPALTLAIASSMAIALLRIRCRRTFTPRPSV